LCNEKRSEEKKEEDREFEKNSSPEKIALSAPGDEGSRDNGGGFSDTIFFSVLLFG